MGGSNKQRKSSLFSFFGMFKDKKYPSGRAEDARDDSIKAYRVRPSDEDTGLWVAEPGIDRKAAAYIAKVHAAAQHEN